MTAAFHATDRAVLRIAGPDAEHFLQGLVTNDLARLTDGPVYAAMLSPQGKYLFDFIMRRDGDDILLDVDASRAADLAKRLSLYRLRAKVEISEAGLAVIVGTGTAPDAIAAAPDPRDARLGWRALVADPDAALADVPSLTPEDYAALRVDCAVPAGGAELRPDDSYVLEMDFERLGGVDFRKGCYVGQEVTARMKHKTELRKGLARVSIEGVAPPPGTQITSDGKPVGYLGTSAAGRGLAYLRFDRATGDMIAGSAKITRI